MKEKQSVIKHLKCTVSSRRVREPSHTEIETGISDLKASDCSVRQAAVYGKSCRDTELTKPGSSVITHMCMF